MRSASQINKTSDLPNGVSRFEEYDRRLANPMPKVGFAALVYVNGAKRIKKFRVSNLASEECAKKTAIAFRYYYEQCINNNWLFDYERMSEWKNGQWKIYP